MRIIPSMLLSFSMCLLSALQVEAKIAATIDPASFTGSGFPVSDSVHGWEFSPSASIVVTHLGLYDSRTQVNLDTGFAQPHPIGIFDAETENLLTEELISPGNQLPLVSDFRYLAISPLQLQANSDYVIAYYTPIGGTGFEADALLTEFNTSPLFNDEIQYLGARFSGGHDRLEFPDQSAPSSSHRFGPNFQYYVVPEAASIQLIAMGAFSTLVLRLRPAKDLVLLG